MHPLILIVDDEPTQRFLLREILSNQAGLTILEAEDGIQALQLARELVPDLILLDIMMPGKDGLKVCEQLKSDPRLRSIPIVIVSALVDHCAIGIKAGADGYLTKPVDEDDLFNALHQALSANSFTKVRHFDRKSNIQ